MTAQIIDTTDLDVGAEYHTRDEFSADGREVLES